MSQKSSPQQVAQFTALYGDLWRHYLVGRESLELATLHQAPFDYWRLVYSDMQLYDVFAELANAITVRPNAAGKLLVELENLFTVQWYGTDRHGVGAVFPGSFFSSKIAPALSEADKLGAVLGYVRLNGLFSSLLSVEQHLQQEQITPWCFNVVKSDVYRAALQRIGSFISQQPVQV